MEVLTPHIEDIPAINYTCDGGVELAMLPVGLLIGKDNLGNLTVAERPTQRPALPSPRQIHAATSPRQIQTSSSPECDDADDIDVLHVNPVESEKLAVDEKLAEEIREEGDGDEEDTCELTANEINEDEYETQLLPLEDMQDLGEVKETNDDMEEDNVSKTHDSNMEATELNSMEVENDIGLDFPDEAVKTKSESSGDEFKNELENLSIDVHKVEESETESVQTSENSDSKSDTQSESCSDNDSVVSSGTLEEEGASKSDDMRKEPPRTSPSNKSKGADKTSPQHKDKVKTSHKTAIKGNNSPLHSPNRRPVTAPNRRGSNERLKISPTKHLSPRDKWKQVTTPEVKRKSLIQKTTPEKNTKEDSVTKSVVQEENLKSKHPEKLPTSTPNTRGDNKSPHTDEEAPLELGKSIIGAESTTHTQRYESVHQLKRSRVQLQLQMEQIDAKLRNSLDQRNALQSLSTHMRESTRAAFELKRNNQGVPFVNAVKELIKRKHDEFQEHTGFLQEYEATLPFYADLEAIFKTFTQVCERMILTTVNYNVTYLEDFHLMAGKLCGMIQSIDTLYFNDYLDEDEDDVADEEDKSDSSSSPPSATERLLERYKRTGPEVNVPNQRINDDILKGLETLVDILSHCNECLANISRLSLGNPKNQSLYDTFVVVSGILKGAEPLMEKFVTLKLPGIGVLATSLQKAARIADVSKPGEKQVEELKCALGDCDGQLFITGKYIFG